MIVWRSNSSGTWTCKNSQAWEDFLSENPSAIELLEEKINRENEMSKEYLETLHHFEKIH